MKESQIEKLSSRLPALIVANCGDCGKMMCSKREQYWELRRQDVRGLPPCSAGRIKGVPYCGTCLEIGPGGISGICGGMNGLRDTSGEYGSWDNAVGTLEDS